MPRRCRIRFQLATPPEAADEVARRLTGARRDGVVVDLVCTPGEKMARLGQIAELGALVSDVEVLPPSLEDIYSHFSGTETPMTRILAVALAEFRIALRNRWVAIAITMMVLFALVLSAAGTAPPASSAPTSCR